MQIGHPTTWGAFKDQNAILFSAPIRNNGLRTDEPFIDLNKDGKQNFKFTSSDEFIWSIDKTADLEPVLNASLEQIRASADRRGLEVVTSADMNLAAQYKTVTSDGKNYHPAKKTVEVKSVPLQDLVPALAPLDKDAEWAVNLKTNEFLIFAPRQQAAAPSEISEPEWTDGHGDWPVAPKALWNKNAEAPTSESTETEWTDGRGDWPVTPKALWKKYE